MLRIKHSFSFLALTYGVMVMFGALSGHDNFLYPLQNNAYAASVTQTKPVPRLFHYASSLPEIREMLADAKAAHKPAMIDFFASWCPSCRAVDRNVFSDPYIQRLMKNFKLIRVDITQENQDLMQIRSRYRVYGVPSIVFYDKYGREVMSDREQVLSRSFITNKLISLS